MAQEDVFKKLVSHCKDMVLCSLPARFMMDWELCMTMVRWVWKLKK